MGTTNKIKPGSFIHPQGLDDQRVVIHPFADRISKPPGFWIFGEFSTVGPDDPPYPVKFIQNDHRHGRLKNLDRKSTRLNSSHRCISYAIVSLTKKKTN